jgi:hypothetical protein
MRVVIDFCFLTARDKPHIDFKKPKIIIFYLIGLIMAYIGKRYFLPIFFVRCSF